MINYNNKTFVTISNSENGDTTEETVYSYKQSGNRVTATYKGGPIKSGFVEASADVFGNLQMQYYHTNEKNELITGICTSTPERMPNGKIRIIEDWQWTCKHFPNGRSILEEIDPLDDNELVFNNRKQITYSI
ncbi:n-acetylglutamate synthase [Saccharicrinis sp. GN24d3]|uniref:n-acetylglutamate synthase n=1 Tax=Saccharicrinis sp. GN24d3 TaxID=3458416 RepID=UPI00403556F3